MNRENMIETCNELQQGIKGEDEMCDHDGNEVTCHELGSLYL